MSAEPFAVFSDLAERCVARFCDSCVVDLTDAGGERRIIHPPSPVTVGGLLGLVARDDGVEHHVVQVRFAHPGDDTADAFAILVTCVWFGPVPTRSERAAVRTSVDDAVGIVLARDEARLAPARPRDVPPE